MNEGNPVLQRELCRLYRAMSVKVAPLVIAGGYGLHLRFTSLQDASIAPLSISPNERTADLDLLLPSEVICDQTQVTSLRDAILQCGFKVIPGREYYQFHRSAIVNGRERSVKLDLLAAAPINNKQRESVKIKGRRIRPHNVTKLHAHFTPEALLVRESLWAIELRCQGEGAPYFLPHPTSLAVMKLFAFRDHLESSVRDGNRHAIDLYRIAVSTTREEMLAVPAVISEHRESPIYHEACAIVRRYFDAPEDVGTLRMRNSLLDAGQRVSDRQIQLFLDLLHDLLALPTTPRRPDR